MHTSEDPAELGIKFVAHSPFVPYDPGVVLYDALLRPFLIPFEYTGWRDEQMSWKKSAYIHGNLNPSPTLKISGPDALRFFEDHCVNSFAKFPVGTGKHAIMCDEAGRVTSHGVLLRTGEDEYISYWLAPYLDYALANTNRDVQGENITGQVFLFQMAGPRSFDILQDATGDDDLSDIRFMGHRLSSIDGAEVRILRMGMGGSLAYEIHGSIEDAHTVYNAILKAGEAHDLRRLGAHAYMMNHTENGFPQSYYHFSYPWSEDKKFTEFMSSMTIQKGSAQKSNAAALRGSMGDDVTLRYRNPVELGWGAMIKFDHDFVGRAALEKEVANPSRVMRTLVWNTDDIMEVQRSQFEPGEHYLPMDTPNHWTRQHGGTAMWADQVLHNGEQVGISSGRAYSYYYRQVISLTSIRADLAEEGTEVSVLWGEPGTRQKEIRAVVSRFPYLNESRNQDIDVSRPVPSLV